MTSHSTHQTGQPHQPCDGPSSLGRAPSPVAVDFPLADTHRGMVLGNSLFGVMVWGSPTQLHITLNRADFWDHRAGLQVTGQGIYREMVDLFEPSAPWRMDSLFETMFREQLGDDCLERRLAFRNTRLPMGRFEFALRQDHRLRHARLDMAHGRLTLLCCRSSGHAMHTIEMHLDPQLPVLVVQDPHELLVSTIARPAWDWVGDVLASRGYQPPTMIDTHDQDQDHAIRSVGWAQAVPHDANHHDPAMAAICNHHAQSLVICMTPGDDAQRAIAAAASLARSVHDEATTPGKPTTSDRASQWWQAYWHDLPEVEIPDPFFNDFLNLALYKFGAATQPDAPLPCALQGPWCEEYQLPPWSGDYHFNVNIQEIYALALATGKTAHLLPLFDMLDRAMPVFRKQARSMVDIDDGVLMTHTTDDRGFSCGGIGPGAAIDQAVSGWTALLYWQYYQYTGNVTFLRERALPFMTGVLKVYDAMLDWSDGRARLPISISAEYAHVHPDGSRQRVGPEASYQYACIHMLCQALAQASAVLDEPADPRWRELAQAVPHWTLTGQRGQQRIAIWKDQDLAISHRHHSHLACVYPFDTLAQRDEHQQAIIRRTLEHWLSVGMSDWSEWSLPLAAIIQAREGYRESPYMLLKLCRDLYINKGMATVYIPNFEGFTLHGLHRKTGPIETCQIMQLDGTMGIATAIYEMLVHRHRGVIRFFPATPEQWRQVRFSNIHLPGRIKAGGRIEQGKVVAIELVATTSQDVTIDVPGYKTLQVDAPSGQYTAALPVTLSLEADKPLHARPIS